MTRPLKHRPRAVIAGIVLGVTALLSVSAPALAAPVPVGQAVGYDYSPGEPAIWGSIGGTAGAYYDKACTGSYAIAGDSGFFLLAARTCSTGLASDGSIRGDAGYHADAVSWRSNDPTVLLRMRPGNDAHQLLVDPLTGNMPGDGAVRGWTRSADQRNGMLIGKMGIDTGWTEGRILGTAPGSFGELLLCTDAPASAGDMGGPVWRNDSTGLRALGTIAGITAAGGACYRPIQETLFEFGAYLPSFGQSQGRPGPGTFAAGMPSYSGEIVTIYAGRIIEKGGDWRIAR